MVQFPWSEIWKYLATLSMHLLFDSAILLQAIYVKDTLAKSLRYTHKTSNRGISKSKNWKQVKWN